jgi:hypothetical protein
MPRRRGTLLQAGALAKSVPITIKGNANPRYAQWPSLAHAQLAFRAGGRISFLSSA